MVYSLSLSDFSGCGILNQIYDYDAAADDDDDNNE